MTTTAVGFIQQLVSCYLPHGYWFYVSGFIPPCKDSTAVDWKLVEKYDIDVCRSTRARRKAAGLANLHYLRYQRRKAANLEPVGFSVLRYCRRIVKPMA